MGGVKVLLLNSASQPSELQRATAADCGSACAGYDEQTLTEPKKSLIHTITSKGLNKRTQLSQITIADSN